MKTKTIFILSLTAILTLAAGSAFGKYSGGTGEPNTPYQIADANDLLALAVDMNDYNKCFILSADINMGGQVFTTAIIAADTNSDWGFQGTAFTGTFDGNGHKIMYFTINGEGNWFLGLFGYISTGGLVKNLGLENFSVSGGYELVGGLTGANSGSISNCYATGAISSGTSGTTSGVGGLVGSSNGSINDCYSTSTVSGGHDVGGLVGYNPDGNINNCYSTGEVNANIDSVGGLVGANDGGSINNCYSIDAVSGLLGVGGLVGINGGNISNCYSTGDVNALEFVGGMVGINNGYIRYCYSIGSVKSSFDVGGMVGIGDSNIISSFWDTNTSGQTSSAGGTGKTTAEMKTLSTFTSAGWDFVCAWGIGNGQTYPYLKPFNGVNSADLNYDGTVDFTDFAIFAANWLYGE